MSGGGGTVGRTGVAAFGGALGAPGGALGSGRGARFDSSAFIRLTATRVSPRTVRIR